MSKKIGITTIVVVMILFFALGSTPDETVTDTNSAIKNAKQNVATDVVIDAGGQAIDQTGKLAVDSACKNGPSQGCTTATNSVNLIGIAFAIMILGIIIVAIYGVARFILSMLESLFN
ncbi:hypothetical protein [Nitrosopumilus sp.]|uniref:hypothetical protein n=1 Tax=Nitrosopumilus sp. TaxID=2024843 RepID=UPI00247E4A17|nr:hypothetical protein [Nitrosopumilus sp.]MCV0410766.1 hypothetical protein [Nitrosopumilus sp.]